MKPGSITHSCLLFLLVMLPLPGLFGQSSYVEKPTIHYINSHNKVWNAGVLYFRGRYGAHSSYYKIWRPRPKSPVLIGFGLSGTFFYASNKMYTSAPMQVRKGSKSPLAIFQSTKAENVDSFLVGNTFMLPANAYFTLVYRVSNNIEAGLHIDLGGITLGAPAQGRVISSSLNGGMSETGCLPTLFNYSLPGSLVRGSLLYHAFGKYWITHKYAAFFSLSYLVSEFSTNTRVVLETARFRNSSFNLMAGLSYAPFYNKTK